MNKMIFAVMAILAGCDYSHSYNTDVIPGGSFEEWRGDVPEGWTWNGNGNTHRVPGVYDTSGVKVVYPAQLVSQNIDVTPSKHSLRFTTNWVDPKALALSVWVEFDGNPDYGFRINAPSQRAEEWIHYSFEIVAPVGSNIWRVRLVAEDGSSIVFDDISITTSNNSVVNP